MTFVMLAVHQQVAMTTFNTLKETKNQKQQKSIKAGFIF